jgi:hypothetical protein
LTGDGGREEGDAEEGVFFAGEKNPSRSLPIRHRSLPSVSFLFKCSRVLAVRHEKRPRQVAGRWGG